MNVVLCLCKTKPFEMDKRCQIIAIVKEKLNILYMCMVLIKKKMTLSVSILKIKQNKRSLSRRMKHLNLRQRNFQLGISKYWNKLEMLPESFKIEFLLVCLLGGDPMLLRIRVKRQMNIDFKRTGIACYANLCLRGWCIVDLKTFAE